MGLDSFRLFYSLLSHTMKTTTQKQEAIRQLRKILRPGKTVETVLRHISRSGMSRVISLCVPKRGESVPISYLAAKALGYRLDDKTGGIKISGCGMDMGFALVYDLGRVLWPKGFKLRKGNRARNGDTSGFDNDGGYALNHRWI